MAGLITGAIALLGEEPHPVAAGLAIASVPAAVACGWRLIRDQHGHEPLPNLLREMFGRSSILEIDGIQFILVAPKTIAPDQRARIRLHLQNCWDHPRTVTLDLHQERRLSLNRAGVHAPDEIVVVVPPAVTGVLHIPVSVDAEARGRYRLQASVGVEGERGTRIRRWRAKAVTTAVPAWATALGALGGILVWGGGLKVDLQVKRKGPPGDGPAEVEWEPLWAPEGASLESAARQLAR